MRGTVHTAALLLAVLLTACARLRGCSRDGRVATLESATGRVDRSTETMSRWRPSAPGEWYAMGDALRTGDGTTARVRLRGGGGIELQPHTTVRFGTDPSGRPRASLRIVEGEAVLQPSTGESMLAETDMGIARVEAGGSVRVIAGAGGLRFEVRVGRVRFERSDGRWVAATAGQRIEVRIAGAIMEAVSAESADAGAPSGVVNALMSARPTAHGDPRMETALTVPAIHYVTHGEGTVVEESAQPQRADLEIEAGSSAVVHDPSGHTILRLAVARECPDGAVVSVVSRGVRTAYRGAHAVTFLAGPGVVRYSATCLDGALPAGRNTLVGRVRFSRDSGAAAVPGRAPQSVVDADGRSYNVLFQNLLPEIAFRWPRPPSASTYTLRVQGASGLAHTARGSEPRILLPAGRLGEGTYRYHFEAAGERSPETTLQVSFDNAARVAQIREPREGAAVTGRTVRVAGIALEGASASANGVELALDGQHRFQGSVPVTENGVVAIRVAHRTLGVNIYLRHLGSSTPR